MGAAAEIGNKFSNAQCLRFKPRGGSIMKGLPRLTFSQDLHTCEPMREALEPVIAKVWQHCKATAAEGEL